MDAEVYVRFIQHMASDLAVRRTEDGKYVPRGHRRVERVSWIKHGLREAGTGWRRVCLRGDHITYGGHTVQSIRELRAKGPSRVHDSDATFRLTMILTAAEMLQDRLHGAGAHGNGARACIMAAEAVMESPCTRWRERFLRGKRGRRRLRGSEITKPPTLQLPKSLRGFVSQPEERDSRFLELDEKIAAQEGKRASRAEADIPLIRLAKTIGSQVSRFRKQNPNWRARFDHQIALFRSDYWRDPDWYKEAEEGYDNWLRDFQKRERPFDWFTAMPIVTLGDIYHEQGKYMPALATFRKAIQAARKAIMHDDLRRYVIRWLRIKMKACVHRARPIGMPAYSGPWLPSKAASS